MATFRARRYAHYRPAMLARRRVTSVAPPSITYATSDETWYDYFTSVSIAAPTNAGGSITSFAVTAGALPAGVSLNTSTGAITGTPTALKTDAIVTITATGPGGTDTFDITIEVLWFGRSPDALGTATALLAGYDTVVGFSSLEDASDGSGGEAADTDPCGWMTDLSGNGNTVIQATSGAKPTVDADGIASKRCLSFDGGDHLARATFVGGASAQPNTVISVVQPVGTGSTWAIMDGGTGNHLMDSVFSASDVYRLYAGSTLSFGASSSALHLMVGLFNEGSSKLWEDNVEKSVSAGTTVGTGTLNGATIGAQQGGFTPLLIGSKGAVWAYFDGDIGASARAAWKTWAVAKFGTPA